jgi:hypothetical protein
MPKNEFLLYTVKKLAPPILLYSRESGSWNLPEECLFRREYINVADSGWQDKKKCSKNSPDSSLQYLNKSKYQVFKVNNT